MADNDIEPQQAAETPQAPEQQAPEPEQAPWEKEGVEFDAEKAWNLVQNLRDENKGLKEKNRAYEDEKLSEKERADRDLAETRAQIEQLRLEKTRAEIRAKYPALTDDDMEFLGSGSPEELEAKAAKLAARIAPQAEAVPDHINPIVRNPTGGIDPTATPKSADPVRDLLQQAKNM